MTVHQKIRVDVGSLKELADHYGVSYPTIRLRLDKVIERIRILEEHAPADALEARVRLLVADGENVVENDRRMQLSRSRTTKDDCCGSLAIWTAGCARRQ